MPKPSLKKMCREVSARSGYVDEETIYMVYRGLIRYILDEIRTKKKIFLPKLGSFSLIHYPAQSKCTRFSARDLLMPELSNRPALNALKFRACTEIKEYVRLMPLAEKTAPKRKK
jgi:nucleoid DNA-binding protein